MMAREKNLSTLIENERVKISMVPGRLVLRPRGEAVVELRSGGFDKMNVETIAIETEGVHRMGMHTRLLDKSDKKDAEILKRVKELLEDRPEYATAVDFQIKIVGEFDPDIPWAGYDDQSADQVLAMWSAMPDIAKPNLEGVMKYELERVNDEGESLTDKAKIELLNKLYREYKDVEKIEAEETVSL